MCQIFLIARDSSTSSTDPWAGRKGDISFVLESGENPGRMVVGNTWNASKGEWDPAPSNTPWDANPGFAPDGKPDFYILEIDGVTKAQLHAAFAKVAEYAHNPIARKLHATKVDGDGLRVEIGRAAGRFSVSLLPAGKKAGLLATGRVKVTASQLKVLLQERLTSGN